MKLIIKGENEKVQSYFINNELLNKKRDMLQEIFNEFERFQKDKIVDILIVSDKGAEVRLAGFDGSEMTSTFILSNLENFNKKDKDFRTRFENQNITSQVSEEVA